MKYSNLCYTQHMFSIRAISILKMKKSTYALIVILTYLDIRRRPEHDVLSDEVKHFGKFQILQFFFNNPTHNTPSKIDR